MLNDTLNDAEISALKAESSYFKEVRRIESLQKRINKMVEKAGKSKTAYENLMFIAIKTR